MNQRDRISKRSVGQFDPKNWFDEGDGLLASSVKMREIWTSHRKTFSQTIRERKRGIRDSMSDWNLLTGLPRSSMLLLGYAVEMYLKAGLAKAYKGCSEDMFERDVKGRFGHKLVSLAKEIVFPLKDDDEKNFILLQGMVLADARYPVFVPDGESYADTVNQQTGRIWNNENYEALTELANRVKEHSRSIDEDSSNPASLRSYNVDDDGYIAFRVGGNLPPRITYCLSSVQKQNCETTLEDIKALLAFPGLKILSHYWERAWIYEDGENKTSLRAQPSG